MLGFLFVAGSLLGFALLVIDTLDLRARAADLALPPSPHHPRTDRGLT